jgi:hypothetical protein
VDVYPKQCLHVPFEPTNSNSSCLVAAVVMAANYLDGRPRFREREVLKQMQADHLDETKPADVQTWLQRQPDGFSLITLRGALTDRPPTGLQYWLLDRGYPVVCIVNSTAGGPEFNHAVVVIGLDGPAGDRPETIHYLDPASFKRVEHSAREQFETWWSRCEHAMALVVRDPQHLSAR